MARTPARAPEPRRTDCTSAEARDIHRKAQQADPSHDQYTTCWCCCFDCGFDHAATIRNDRANGVRKSVY